VTSLVETLTFDSRDPGAAASFWCVALGYELDGADDEGAWIRDPRGAGWPILFLVVPEAKSVKNRLHLDLSPPSTMAEEVERLSAAGARAIRRVDEAGSFWTVMNDPEGNEFCVLRGPNDDPPKARPA
jgi:Glyoxalase-like domain